MNQILPEQTRHDIIMLALERYKFTNNPDDPIVKNAINTVVGAIILESLQDLGIEKYLDGEE